MSKAKLLSLLFAGTVGCVGTASAAHIDFVDTDAFALTGVSGFPVSTVQTNVAGTPGGSWTRTASVTLLTGGPVTFELNPAGVTDSLTQGAVYTGAAGSVGIAGLQYNGFAGGSADFLNIPASTDDWTRIDVVLQDVLQATVRATLQDIDGSIHQIITPILGGGTGTATTVSLDYATFLSSVLIPGTTPGLDLSQISSFQFELGVPSFDANAPTGTPVSFAITDLRRAGTTAVAVPAPASLLLVAFGLVAMRRRMVSK